MPGRKRKLKAARRGSFRFPNAVVGPTKRSSFGYRQGKRARRKPV